jgi:hypothetical protein
VFGRMPVTPFDLCTVDVGYSTLRSHQSNVAKGFFFRGVWRQCDQTVLEQEETINTSISALYDQLGEGIIFLPLRQLSTCNFISLSLCTPSCACCSVASMQLRFRFLNATVFQLSLTTRLALTCFLCSMFSIDFLLGGRVHPLHTFRKCIVL